MDRFERFSVAITEISYHVHRLMTEAMEQYGLRGINAMYLIVLCRHEQGMTAAQLGDHCSRDKADVSRAVAVLEEKGLVTKAGSRYRAKLHLTEQGSVLAKRLRALAQSAVEIAGGGLTEEQRAILYTSLDSIVEKLQMLTIDALPEDRP